MLRGLALGLAALSIGCAAETYVAAAETEAEADCHWAVVMVISVDEDAGDCIWSIQTLDDTRVRLRSVDGEPAEPVHSCEVITYRRVEALRPQDSVECWSPEDIDRSTIWSMLEMSPCN